MPIIRKKYGSGPDRKEHPGSPMSVMAVTSEGCVLICSLKDKIIESAAVQNQDKKHNAAQFALSMAICNQ